MRKCYLALMVIALLFSVVGTVSADWTTREEKKCHTQWFLGERVAVKATVDVINIYSPPNGLYRIYDKIISHRASIEGYWLYSRWEREFSSAWIEDYSRQVMRLEGGAYRQGLAGFPWALFDIGPAFEWKCHVVIYA